MEVFSPGYLSAPTRPTITAAPTTATNGATINITTPDATEIAMVTLVRPHSVTHHTDAGHRWIRVPVTDAGGGSLDVDLPGPTLAPPGWYLLFLVDGAGTPSTAHWLQLM